MINIINKSIPRGMIAIQAIFYLKLGQNFFHKKKLKKEMNFLANNKYMILIINYKITFKNILKAY